MTLRSFRLLWLEPFERALCQVKPSDVLTIRIVITTACYCAYVDQQYSYRLFVMTLEHTFCNAFAHVLYIVN